MDYNLLIGLHFRDDSSVDEMKSSPRSSHSGNRDMFDNEMLTCWGPLIQLDHGTCLPQLRVCKAGLDHQTTSGSSNSQISDVILYFGIIDILQDYYISKKIEHAYRSHYKWTPLLSQLMIPSYTPKGLGISFTESL
ncbi:hypothetical protein AAZV13_19G069000 [Glycine max]|uniref:phosphatidylinositol 4-phosphate 5-kinase 2-like isoform X2 n=1 Tax=Glycine max TaxID=3847 RepID=UPI001B355EEA|nr:phosphatidylinositol 4-phosphate 5-kinase 2-like isoform X2 [Glycine max]